MYLHGLLQVKRIHRFTATLGEKRNDRGDVEARLAIMISTIVSIFAVCNSFESIVFILTSQEMLSLDTVQNYLRPIADFLMVFNSSINVVIYCIFKKEFREKFFQLYLQCSWKKKNPPKPLPVPIEKSMIPMIRAQLPKTSVEMTFASKGRLQHETTFIYHPVPTNNVNDASLLLGPNSSDNITPSSLNMDSQDLVETSKENEHGDTANSEDISVRLRESTISIDNMGAQLSNSSVKLAEITKEQNQDIINNVKGQELEALSGPESRDDYKPGNIDVHIEDNEDIAENYSSDDNINKANENEASENEVTSKNLSRETTIETSDASTKELKSSTRNINLESTACLNEEESCSESETATSATSPRNVLSIEQANDLAKKIISDVLQAVAERTTEVETKNNVCSLVEDITVEGTTVKEDATVEEDASVKEDAAAEEHIAVKEDSTVEEDAAVEEDATVKEDAAVEVDAAVEEDTAVEEDATFKDATVEANVEVLPMKTKDNTE